jgi:hypothetical protein
MCGVRKISVAIIERFKKIGAAAGAEKCLRELSTPLKRDNRLTRNI